ncbi:MAG: type II toxin-antitoxin system HicB family antitoxin [Candidatus Eremiobacteraeota bacterium]|nr:type II toxin-antitoxin system HicB family antitoxin [Candidatus Eremiobacteraeota bacterium]MBC5802017.1 type II toxin-antitoxin system HicB family antitoxin [Candidatus Eremiobacteraeota bacterium]MBC5822579.1 type II toxin-antitoxin system HicB family antitoxin [Candidatus Eremiobacteraeota bacterium]
MNYYVVIEQGDRPRSFGAYVPDLPGCVATGSSREQVRTRIRAAIELHVAGLREDGLPVPKPTTVPEVVTVTSRHAGGYHVAGPQAVAPKLADAPAAKETPVALPSRAPGRRYGTRRARER